MATVNKTGTSSSFLSGFCNGKMSRGKEGTEGLCNAAQLEIIAWLP